MVFHKYMLKIVVLSLLLGFFIPSLAFYPRLYWILIAPSPQEASAPRMIQFSNFTWIVRNNSALQGPGPNRFSDSLASVNIDEYGWLHLKTRFDGGNWWCAEVFTEASFGYGTYRFVLAEGFEKFDVNTVLGLFTYYNDTQEIDVEMARWGDANDNVAQYALQPAGRAGNLHRFPIQNVSGDSVHEFTWCANYIHFVSRWNETINNELITRSAEWWYAGSDNPLPRTERVHLNLWLMSGLAPVAGLEDEVIIKSFTFTPNACDASVSIAEPDQIDWKLAWFALPVFTWGVLVYTRRKLK
jgi:hypothetical protein